MLDYATIELYYKNNDWTAKMVHDAVLKGKITMEEYKKIVGENAI